MTPSSAGRAAADAQPAQLVLYHLYPEVDGQAALRTVQGLFPGPVVVAEDGDCFSLIRKK
jgi:ribonuclease BN (tRNA processing enzyme)